MVKMIVTMLGAAGMLSLVATSVNGAAPLDEVTASTEAVQVVGEAVPCPRAVDGKCSPERCHGAKGCDPANCDPQNCDPANCPGHGPDGCDPARCHQAKLAGREGCPGHGHAAGCNPATCDRTDCPGRGPDGCDPSKCLGHGAEGCDPARCHPDGTADAPCQKVRRVAVAGDAVEFAHQNCPGRGPGGCDPGNCPGHGPNGCDPSKCPGHGPDGCDPSQCPGHGSEGCDPATCPRHAGDRAATEQNESESQAGAAIVQVRHAGCSHGCGGHGTPQPE